MARLLHIPAPDDLVIECPDCGDPLVEGKRCSCFDPHPANCTCEDCERAGFDPQTDVPYPAR